MERKGQLGGFHPEGQCIEMFREEWEEVKTENQRRKMPSWGELCRLGGEV